MQPSALCTKLCDKAASASSRQYDTKLLLSTFKEHSYNHTKIFSNMYLCDEIGKKKTIQNVALQVLLAFGQFKSGNMMLL